MARTRRSSKLNELPIRLVATMHRVAVVAAATIAVAIAALGCSHTPTAPTPPPPPHASIAIVSLTVEATTDGSAGYTYRVVLQLKESGGAPASIAAVDLTFMDGSAALVTSHHDRPLDVPTVPANGTMTTRELETLDGDPSHACAKSVRATVTFNPGAADAGTATAVAEVAPPAPPPPRTFTLTGVVSDEATNRGIGGGTVSVLDGPNAGKSSNTDGNGYYSIPTLGAGSFTVQARANGYDASNSAVTLTADTRLDLKLRRTDPGPPPPPGPTCTYTMSPSGATTISEYGGSASIAITRTAGTCGWQATADVNWMTLGSASGNGNGTLAYTVDLNFGFFPRTGVISIAWTGGSLRLNVTQLGNSNPFCIMFVRVGGQSTLSVGAAGGQFVATIGPLLPTPPGLCGAWTASATPPISFVGSISGSGSGAVTFTVPSNGAQAERTMQVTVDYRDPNTLRQTVLTVRQTGTP